MYSCVVSKHGVNYIFYSSHYGKERVYPAFDLSALSVGEIRVYADLPFRGKEHPMVIPCDEMVELIKSGKAKMKL